MDKQDPTPAGDDQQKPGGNDDAPSPLRIRSFLNPSTAPIPSNVSAAPTRSSTPPITVNPAAAGNSSPPSPQPAPAPATAAIPPAANPPAPSPGKPLEPGAPETETGPAATGDGAPDAAGPNAWAKTLILYDRLFPRESPQRKAGPWVVVVGVLIVLLLGKCALSSAGDKISAFTAARAEEKRVQSTGVLVVKSNRPEATIEARLLASADAPEPARGALGQALSNLLPGKYAVTLRAAGWPDARGEVDVPPGQPTEVTINFQGGSLRLDSIPSGATARLGNTVLGRTPLVIPQLPPGENTLTLEYPFWPARTFKTVITADVESTETVRLPHAKLTVESYPAGAAVLLGKRTLGATPLVMEHAPAGTLKLTLQAKDFPPMELPVTVIDGVEAKIRPILGSVFPLLDPAELLRAVWLPDDSPVTRVTTGLYKPRNDVVKNLRREWLYNGWLHKIYRITGPIKVHDAAGARVEFAEQKSELARYRVVARLKPGAQPGKPAPKDTTLTVYGRLTAVDEPAWPGRVITLELTEADFLPDEGVK
jgi:hypothetical protein